MGKGNGVCAMPCDRCNLKKAHLRVYISTSQTCYLLLLLCVCSNYPPPLRPSRPKWRRSMSTAWGTCERVSFARPDPTTRATQERRMLGVSFPLMAPPSPPLSGRLAFFLLLSHSAARTAKSPPLSLPCRFSLSPPHLTRASSSVSPPRAAPPWRPPARSRPSCWPEGRPRPAKTASCACRAPWP